jgi:hypothetical protein
MVVSPFSKTQNNKDAALPPHSLSTHVFASDAGSLPDRFQGRKQRRFRFSILLQPLKMSDRDQRLLGAHRK